MGSKKVKCVHAILAIAALIFSWNVKSQSTCGTAVNLPYPFSQTVSSYTASAYWFKVNLGVGHFEVTVTKTAGSTGRIQKADLNSGSCASLSYIRTDSAYIGTDSTFKVYIESAATADYFVQLYITGGSTNFKVATTQTVNITGDMAACSGVPIQLSELVANPGSGPSYAWSPSAVLSCTNCASPVATITATTTFTLSYSDGNGAAIATATVYLLPAGSCKSCELVVNGSFESIKGFYNSPGDIYSVVSNCTLGDNLNSWYDPTCGSADAYHLYYPGQMTVPLNWASNTNANSGKGYTGFFTYNASGNYREYIQEQIKCPLAAGQAYNVSFYAFPATNMQYTTNNIGLYVSTASITSSGTSPLSYTPQINSGSITTHTVWTQVSGQYTAIGGEQYITIGNFYDDAHTTKTQTYPGAFYPHGYYLVDDISITPATPTLTASSLTVTCASAATLTLTATGAPTSTLTSWTDGYTTWNGNPASVPRPFTTTTYTCTVSSCTGCTPITQTITVTVSSANTCSGTPPASYTVSSGSLTANPAYIATNLTIATGGTYTINSADVRIAPGVQITVQPSATLTINDSWLHACAGCSNSMWQGIYVDNGGVLVLNSASTNYSIIEDAIMAVKTATSTSATPVPVFKITNTIFNKNTKAVYIDQHPGNYTNSIAPYNDIFTCRTLSSTAPTSTNFNNIKTNVTSATPINTSTVNPTTNTLAGTRSTHGFYINNRTLTTATLAIGNSSQANNLFDNMDYGIYVSQSNLKVFNSRFQNLTGNSRKLHVPIGIGIYAVNNADGLYTLQVGNGNTTYVSGEVNTFLSCCKGIFTQFYSKEWINGNTFDCETTASGFNTTSLVAGEYAVLNQAYGGTVASAEQLQFANNTVNNYATGFLHDYAEIFNTSSASCYWYNNTISSYTTTASPNNYVNFNLYLSSNDGMTYTAVPQDAMKVEANTFTNAMFNAITATGVGITSTNGGLTIYHNTELGVKYLSTYTTYTAPSNPPVAAVYLTGCKYVKVSDNGNIKCTGLSSYPSTNAEFVHGVYVSQSTNSIVNCNSVTYMGEDFVWEGVCSGSIWLENSMQNSRFGLVLRSSGIMGDQGSSSAPIYDVWGKFVSTNITDDQTLCDRSDPSVSGSTSKLYTKANTCSSSITHQPCQNTAVGLGSFAYASGTTLITATSTVSPCVCSGDCGTQRFSSSGVASDSLQADSSLIEIVQGIELGDTLPIYDREAKWAVQYYVSSLDSTISPADSYENARKLAMADISAATGDYSSSQAIGSSVSTNNIVEANWKHVSEIVLRKISDSSYIYSNDDISTLEDIAIQCPLAGGSIVYKARAVLNSYYGGIVEYPDACNASSLSPDPRPKITAGAHITGSSFKLYPNPNNGSIYIEYQVDRDASLEIIDISGKLVGRYILSYGDYNIQIANDNIEDGIYLYRVVSDSRVIAKGKIAIMK